MFMFRRFTSVSFNLFHLHQALRFSEYVSSRVACLNRPLSKINSGCFIAGCCFSRQSDEETPLISKEKSNYEFPETQKTDYLHPDSAHTSENMKRSFETLTDVALQLATVHPTSSSDLCNKKKRIRKKDYFEGKEPVIKSVSPDNGSTDLQKLKPEDKETSKSKIETEKLKKCRPNYFVAIKISDSQIHQTLNELQKHMLEKDERLNKSMIQLATLHITLMVMYIGDTETHARALEVLENIHQEHDDDFSKNPLKLEFKGLSHFQNRVLYAKLLADDDSYKRLSSLAESVKQHFEVASIFTTDSRAGFTPHLTVAKIRDEKKKSKKQNKFPKKIDPSLYQDFNDQYFGSQHVQSIQLLKMTGPKDEVGYYSGNEIYFSAFDPKSKQESMNTIVQETQKKKKNVREMIQALMKKNLKG